MNTKNKCQEAKQKFKSKENVGNIRHANLKIYKFITAFSVCSFVIHFIHILTTHDIEIKKRKKGVQRMGSTVKKSNYKSEKSISIEKKKKEKK